MVKIIAHGVSYEMLDTRKKPVQLVNVTFKNASDDLWHILPIRQEKIHLFPVGAIAIGLAIIQYGSHTLLIPKKKKYGTGSKSGKSVSLSRR